MNKLSGFNEDTPEVAQFCVMTKKPSTDRKSLNRKRTRIIEHHPSRDNKEQVSPYCLLDTSGYQTTPSLTNQLRTKATEKTYKIQV